MKFSLGVSTCPMYRGITRERISGLGRRLSIRMPPTLAESKIHHDVRHLVRPQMTPYE